MLNLTRTRLHISHQGDDLSKEAKVGVSLHCHTEHSKEMMDFIPHYAEKMPMINYFWRRERDNWVKRTGRDIDFSTAYWSPPLPAHDVYEIEKKQIEGAGLEAIVSISDHDSIDGTVRNLQTRDVAHAPISLEWTVPFEYGFFHVGVHNLPKDRAVDITKDLLAYTFSGDENPSNAKLTELFAMLNEIPEVLIILNHPLWDIEMVGKERHLALLKHFIRDHVRWIHAFEINGFRSWSENKAIIEMAEALGIPIATGGDRHGCKPNTVINLTNSRTFDEFVEEIRVERRSEVVLMPEYRQPLHSRQLQSFSEILSLYPNHPEGRRRWFDRVFFDIGTGKGLSPVSAHGWEFGPFWLRCAIWTLGFLGSPKMRPFFELARKSRDRVPKDAADTDFKILSREEVAPGSLSSEPV